MSAVEHMNSDHLDIIEALCKHFGTFDTCTNVKLQAMDPDGMDIVCDEGKVRVPFLSKGEEGKYRFAIMEVMQSIGYKHDMSGISKKMLDFIDEFKTVGISSFNGEHCVASYAPVIRDGEDFYVLISEVPAHFKSILGNPEKVQIIFLEDEKTAKTIFARRRVSFNVKAILCDEKRDEVIAKMHEKFPDEAPLSTVEMMADFHAVKFEIGKGRLVFGFGAAYDTDKLNVITRVGGKMPHKTGGHPHKH